MAETSSAAPVAQPSDAWSDLALTLPLFVAYHLGVVFLPVRNAADIVTRELVTRDGAAFEIALRSVESEAHATEVLLDQHR